MNNFDDFKKFATGHVGVNSMVLDDVMKAQAGYLNPYILEERQLNVTQLDELHPALQGAFCLNTQRSARP